MELSVVLVTVKDRKEGEKIQRGLVESRIAACVSLVPDVSSCYTWKGRLEAVKEALLIIKTRTSLVDRLVEKVRELHSYDVPEVIALPIIKGSEDYLKWVGEVADG